MCEVSQEDDLTAKSCWYSRMRTKRAGERVMLLELLNVDRHCEVQNTS